MARQKGISLSHLKVFGCVPYVRVSDADRDKLDPKARKCIFIGYGADDMGYRFWDDQTRKIIRVGMSHSMKMQCTRTDLKRNQQRRKR